MKVFLRTFNPLVNERTGLPHPPGTVAASAGRWSAFEAMMKNTLRSLGHNVVEQAANPLIPDDTGDAQFTIYSHLTRRERPAGNLFHKEMHLAGLFTLDPVGWGADDSRMKVCPDFDDVDSGRARNLASELRERFLCTGSSKHPQPPPAEFQGLDKFILVALQVPRDYVIKHHSPVSVIEFIGLVSDWADSRRQNVAFKLHPGNSRDVDIADEVARRAAGSPYVHSVSGNIHSLISDAIGVFVINSGVGFESLIHGKPVVTFGDCDYKWVTFRAGRADLDSALAFVHHFSDDSRLAGFKFLYHYIHRHGFSVDQEIGDDCCGRLSRFLDATISSASSR